MKAPGNRPYMRVLQAFGLVLLTCLPAGAQFSIPDPRNSVQALALGGDGALYMATFGNGVFKSHDGGQNWKSISEGLKEKYIYSLLVLPAPKDRFPKAKTVIYAGGARLGIYRTTDGGKTWDRINAGLKNKEILKIAAGPKNRLFAATGQGVYRSDDFGETWNLHREGLEDILVRSIAFGPDGTIYAGTGGKGLFKLKPKDRLWTQLTRGLQGANYLKENFIRVLTLGSDGTLYAGTFDGGVFTSRDGGINWKNITLGLKNHSIRAILLDEKGDVIIATGRGVFTQTPGDMNWRSISGDLEDLNFQTMIIDRKTGRLYGGTGGGLYRGTLSGKWVSLTEGLFQAKEGT